MCSERSGSNLLRCIFDAHPDVYAPNTMALGHLCANYYGRLSGQGQSEWKQLVSEVARRVNDSTFYAGVSVSENELLNNIEINDVSGLYFYPYLKGMKLTNAKRVMIKEHQAWRIAPFFLKSFPGGKIIIQVRDPRDHAVSCKRLGKIYEAYHGSVLRAARMWKNDQTGASQIMETFGQELVRVHRYEDLVRQPQETLLRICEFVGLDWRAEMLEFYKAEELRKRSTDKYLHNMWANLDRPITGSRVGRWRESLGSCEQRLVEREAGELIQRFGYDSAIKNTNSRSSVFCRSYEFGSVVRYLAVTAGIWLAWIAATGDFSVPHNVVFGNAIRGHNPYERFRDRIGYRII
jgi:hypothetical protein